MSKDIFSGHADIYVKYRPLYPKELYDFLLQYVKARDMALDCGTGNGQAAGVLAAYFTEVHATDISDKQIEKAIQKPNLHYHICKAEKTPFDDDCFDLITCATAAHWFQFDEFFKEMTRIGRNDAVFACWAYNLVRTDQAGLNKMIDQFYYEKIYHYWDQERRHVEEGYKNIPFPFEEIKNPGFTTKLDWDLDTLEGYLNTWSAVQHFIQKNAVNPVTEFMENVRAKFNPELQLQMDFPIFMRIGIIKK
jgi:SAM-dependent methyltransferase